MSEARMCSKCGQAPAGPGGVLCGGCTTTVSDTMRDYWTTDPAQNSHPSPEPVDDVVSPLD